MKTLVGHSHGALCRMDHDVILSIAEGRDTTILLLPACLTVLLGSVCYGFAFGLWRAPMQAFYSAIKMPILIFSTTLLSCLINTMLAQVMGTRLSFKQVWICILLSLAIASALLGALSPVIAFFATQIPSPSSDSAMMSYSAWLLINTLVVGVCGIIGNCRLYGLLLVLTGTRLLSARVLLCWILISGLVGSELSWLISPFLAKPGMPVPILNPDAFKGNIFEYLWRYLNDMG